jgi:hypothetical protein
MVSRLFIHVGFHKTGTTAIQNCLWTNRERLAAQGVSYPAVALAGPTHAKLANVFKGEAFRAALTKMRPWPGPDEFDPYRMNEGEDAKSLYESLHQAIVRDKPPTTVISSECFLEWIEPARVAEQILSWGMDVKIIVYVRRQDLWIQSVFNQIVKDRFLRYRGDFADMPQHAQMDYKTILDPWAAAFGREHIIVRVYEPGQLKDDDVVTDFLSLIGIARSTVEVKNRDAQDNPSLHREIVSILHKTNALPVGVLEHRLILEALSPLNDQLLERDGRESFDILDREQQTAIFERYQHSNREVAKIYLGRDDGMLFRQEPC